MLALTDFDELKSLLNLEKDDIDDYPALAAIISSVYAAIETYTGRELEFAKRTETLDQDGRLVPLKAIPVAAVTAVTLDGVATTQYVLKPDGIKLHSSQCGTLAVSYSGGYKVAPDGLKRAAMLQVMHELQRKDHIGAESVSNEGGFTRWPQLGLLDEVKRMLAPFRHPAAMI